MVQPLALIVDDEPDIRELITMTLERMKVTCIQAADITTAKQQLAQQAVQLCLTDMRLPDGDGIELVEYMQIQYPQIPVAVITAYGNMELAVTALKAGAFDFVSKPVNLLVLRDLVNTALKLSAPVSNKEQLDVPKLLGISPAMNELRTMIAKLARSQAPILITGASGTGKELVARRIHQQGPRAESPFVPVNCGAIPSELMESEFFGYKKGSFTGALKDYDGLFRAAHKGTLFLDEVAELPLHMQVKLLRAIQEKAVRPIGMSQEVPIDVRILSATHKNLHELIERGEFRQDLFYRINVIQLDVPELHERPEDIPILCEHILQRLAHALQVSVPVMSDEATAFLQSYEFPGNVRELENMLERAVTLCEKNTIKKVDLKLLDADEERTTEAQVIEQNMPLGSYLDNVEKEIIVKALQQNKGNKAKTAEQLGLSLRALRYRLQKLHLDE